MREKAADRHAASAHAPGLPVLSFSKKKTLAEGKGLGL